MMESYRYRTSSHAADRTRSRRRRSGTRRQKRNRVPLYIGTDYTQEIALARH